MATRRNEARLTAVTTTRCQGVAATARQIGCSPGHLTYIMHGKRKANEAIRRCLARMGITTNIYGEAL